MLDWMHVQQRAQMIEHQPGCLIWILVNESEQCTCGARKGTKDYFAPKSAYSDMRCVVCASRGRRCGPSCPYKVNK